jgi:hypothetical protein
MPDDSQVRRTSRHGARARTARRQRLLVDDEWVDGLVREDQEALRWVVIDDLGDVDAELAISPWPRLTDDGRLRFADHEEEYAFGVMPKATLQELLDAARARQRPPVAARPLRVGDALAARIVVDADGAATFPDDPPALGDVTVASRGLVQRQEAAADDAPVEASHLKRPRKR